jgi:hypothetical protein
VRTENSFPSVSGWYRKFDCGTDIGQALVVDGGPWYTGTAKNKADQRFVFNGNCKAHLVQMCRGLHWLRSQEQPVLSLSVLVFVHRDTNDQFLVLYCCQTYP